MAIHRIAIRLFLCLTLSAAALLSAAPTVQAGFVCLWTGVTGNDWGTAANWSGCNGGVPGASDTASISAAAMRPDPVLNSSAEVFQLDINVGTVLITTGGTTLTTAFLNLNGAISGPGNVSVTNTWVWGTALASVNDGLLSGGGQIVVESGALGRINNLGESLRLSNYTVKNYGTLEPYSGSSYVVFVANAALHNYGIFAMSGVYQDDSDTNTIYNHSGATIQGVGGAVMVDTALINDGTLDSHAGEFSICRGGTQTGDFISNNGALLYFGSCNGLFSPTTFTFTLDSDITASRVHFTGMPTTSVNFSGTFGPMGTVSETYIEVPTTFTSDARVNSFGNGLYIYSSLILNATAPTNLLDLIVSGSNGSFNYSGTINIMHDLTCQYGATLSGGGLLRVQETKTLHFTGSAGGTACKLDGKWVENQGVGSWSGASDIIGLNNSILTNKGTFTSWGGDSMSGSLTFDNQGSLIKDTPGTTTTISAAFTNSGSVQVKAGALVFTGDVTLPAGSTNQIKGTFQAGNLVNNGDLTVDGTVQGNLTNNGNLSMKGTVTGDLVNNFSLDPGGVSAGLIVVQGSFSQPSSGGMGIDLTPPAPGLAGMAAPVPGVDFDQIQVSGTVQLGGHLQMFGGDGYFALPNFTRLAIITSGAGVSGEFDSMDASDVDEDDRWMLLYLPNGVTFQSPGYLYVAVVKR